MAPKISIKGYNFESSDGVISTKILEAVVVGANPRVSKTWYSDDWSEERESTTPDCYSLDGIEPSESSRLPQNDICAPCPQNARGSRTTPLGVKVKACADQKRLALVQADNTDGEVYLLQVAPASLKNLNAYQKELSMRGIVPEIARTKISFEQNTDYPKLRFSFGGFNSESAQVSIDKLIGTDEVKIITGELAVHKGHTSSAEHYGFAEEDGYTSPQD